MPSTIDATCAATVGNSANSMSINIDSVQNDRNLSSRHSKRNAKSKGSKTVNTATPVNKNASLANHTNTDNATSIAQPSPSEMNLNLPDDLSDTIQEAFAGIDNSYFRDVQKNIRNVSKKINSMAKVDAVIAENPDVSLDDLVASRKINADQKAQALKKPSLQAQLTQLEYQLNIFRKVDSSYRERLISTLKSMEAKHKEDMKLLEERIRHDVQASVTRDFRSRLLIFSRFLRAAAAQRQTVNQSTAISLAFEGALLLVYGGDSNAVAAAERIIEGSNDRVTSTEGNILDITYSTLRRAALGNFPLNEQIVLDELEKLSLQSVDSLTSEQPINVSRESVLQTKSTEHVSCTSEPNNNSCSVSTIDTTTDGGIESQCVKTSTTINSSNQGYLTLMGDEGPANVNTSNLFTNEMHHDQPPPQQVQRQQPPVTSAQSQTQSQSQPQSLNSSDEHGIVFHDISEANSSSSICLGENRIVTNVNTLNSTQSHPIQPSSLKLEPSVLSSGVINMNTSYSGNGLDTSLIGVQERHSEIGRPSNGVPMNVSGHDTSIPQESTSINASTRSSINETSSPSNSGYNKKNLDRGPTISAENHSRENVLPNRDRRGRRGGGASGYYYTGSAPRGSNPPPTSSSLSTNSNMTVSNPLGNSSSTTNSNSNYPSPPSAPMSNRSRGIYHHRNNITSSSGGPAPGSSSGVPDRPDQLWSSGNRKRPGDSAQNFSASNLSNSHHYAHHHHQSHRRMPNHV